MSQKRKSTDMMDLDFGSFRSGADQPDAEDDACLSWSLDPENKCMSDYKIIINTVATSTSQEQEVVYHVHKLILTLGPRKSLYFARLFRSGIEVAEHARNTSSIELEPSAAKAFPKMLDFMYSPNKEDEGEFVTPEDAVVLRHLASYFDVEALYDEVTQFMRNDLTNIPTNAPLYVADAILYRDDKILEAASSLCVEKFDKIEPEVMAKLPLQFFRETLLSSSLIQEENSDVLSRHVAAICRYHVDEINRAMILELTDNDTIPTIASDVALYLMGLSDTHSLPKTSEAETSTGPTLHERCVKVMSKEWCDMIYPNIVDGNEEGAGGGEYSSLAPEFKVELLEAIVKSLPEFCLKEKCANSILTKDSNGHTKCKQCNKYQTRCRNQRCRKRFQYLFKFSRSCPHCKFRQ